MQRDQSGPPAGATAPIKLVINGMSVAPGGGLTSLLGLLEGWSDIQAAVQPVIVASRPQTLEFLEKAGWSHAVQPLPHRSALLREWLISTRLPRLVQELKADVLLSTNAAVSGVTTAQVVHHQNLYTCFARDLWTYAKLGTQLQPGQIAGYLEAPKHVLRAVRCRSTLRSAAANVFISRHVQSCAEQVVPESAPRNHTIYYGLSRIFAEVGRETPPGARQPFQICAMQSHMVYKDNPSLLRAFSMAVQRAPQHPWRLRIAGVGNFGPYQQLAQSLGVGERIVWHPYLSPREVARMLHESTMLVYPSVFEGFGLPLIEAMACGCVAPGVDCTAVPETVAGAALLVPPHSPEQIAEGMLRVCTDDAFRAEMQQRGARRAAEFSWTRTAAGFCDVFAKVLGRPVPYQPPPTTNPA